MATRHELIHIDFVANAGKANPVLKSLKDACEDTRRAKEATDKALANAKAAGAAQDIIDNLTAKLKAQDTTYKALQRGVREYAKGIDTLSKGIKEYNEGTLDEMSAKFNKSLVNAARLAQSAVKTGSKEWNQLQTIIEAAERNVARAKEDIVALMQSLKDGSSVSTVQLSRAKEALQDLARLAVTNSEEWRGLTAQVGEIDKALNSVAETERRLKGEITTENDAIELSNHLTKESIALRHADGEAARDAARKEREGVQESMRTVQERMNLRSAELEKTKDEIKHQENLDNLIKKRDQRISDATAAKQDAERRRTEAEDTIKAYDELKKSNKSLKAEIKEEEEAEKKAARTKKESAKATNEQTASLENQEKIIKGLKGEVGDFDTKLKDLDEKIKKANSEPIKLKVDDSDIKEKKNKTAEESAAAKEKETKATEKNTEAVKEEKKANEDAAKATMSREETIKQLQERYDKARSSLQTLYEERKELTEAQKEGAAATKEEANAFKDLTREQAQAMLEARQKLASFSTADGKTKISNLEEAQSFIFDAAKKINPKGTISGAVTLEGDQEINELVSQFQSRYGLKDADETRGIIKSVIADNSGFVKKGFMNKFILNIEQNTQKLATYSKEMNQLTDIINGQTQAVDKNAESQRTLAQVEDEIKIQEKEQYETGLRLNKLRSGAKDVIDGETQKTEQLTEAKKKNTEATKAQIEAIKKMSAEQAKSAYDEMTAMSTVGYKANKLDMSNPEEVQSYIITQMRKKSKSKIGEDGGLTIAGRQIDDLMKDFRQRYGLTSDNKDTKKILKEIISGTDGGLLKAGAAGFQRTRLKDEEGGKDTTVDTFSIKVDKEAYDARLQKIKALTDITNAASYAAAHANETTKEGTVATKESTKATEKDTQAIAEQIKEVERRKTAYDKSNSEYEAKKTELERMRKKLKSLPSSGADALLERNQLNDEIKEYKENTVDPAGRETRKLKRLWEKSAKDLLTMQGIEPEAAEATKKGAAADEQAAGAAEKKARGKKKAAEATKEDTEAAEKSVKAEKTLEELQQEKANLEAQQAEKKKLLQKAEEELAKMKEEATKKSEESAQAMDKEAKSTETLEEKKARLAKQEQEEAEMKKAAKDAGTAKRKANKDITNAANEIADANELKYEDERISDAELNQKRKQVEAIRADIEKDAQTADQLSQRIAQLNKQETDAAIEMAQSENVSIEKVKQSIELLQKKIQTEATDTETMQARGEAINRLKERLTEMNAEVAKLSEPIADKLKVENADDLGKMSETEIRQAIEAANQLVKTYDVSDEKVKELTNNIARAEQYLKEHGVEAARIAQREAAQLELNTKRMDSLGSLSNAAFDETKRFWQAMYDGAEKDNEKLKEIEEHLKEINEEEKRRTRSSLEQSAGRLGRTNLGTLSSNELRQAIADAKTLQGTYAETSKEAQALANMIVKAEEYAKTHGVEAVRQAQKEKEAVRQREEQEQQLAVQMRERLTERKTLSADALAETKKYWLAQKNGAEEGTIAFRRAETALKMLDNVESERNAARNKQLAERLNTPANFGNYTTAELQESINAAKQLALSYKSGSNEAIELAKNIVAAEEHVNKFGVEAARQAKTIEEMQEQLEKGADLTESALKAQENYWRRLADDPKATNEEMKKYIANMQKAQQLQNDLIANRGKNTLERAQKGEFNTANMTDLSTAIKEIKEYQALIKDPNGAGKDTFADAKEQVDGLTAKLNALKGVAESTKSTFASVDEVMKRFGEHMGTANVENVTQQTETLSKTLDEKLAEATSSWDNDIENATKNIGNYEQQVKKATEELNKMEQELEELEKKHTNSSWFRKQTEAYRREGWRIEELEEKIGGRNVTSPDGSTYITGTKGDVAWFEKQKNFWKERLEWYKQAKAEELGLNEAEEKVNQTEEKLNKTRRMTKEELQEGIKLLEAEALAQDRTTSEGKKRWEELRQTIDDMNQELKESTGEWMSLKQAKEIAATAGNKDFFASSEQIQKASQAIERQREALMKSIQKRGGNATDTERQELQRLAEMLRKLKFEQDNFNMSHEKMQTLMETPKSAVNLEELRAAIKRADDELHLMEDSLGDGSEEYQKFAAQVKNAKNELKQMEGQAKATVGQFEKAWGRLKTYVGLYVGASVAMNKLVGTMSDLAELSDKMGEVRKTTGFTADEVGRLSENLKKMDVRTPLVQLMEISASAGQLGLKTLEDVQGFTEAANKLMIALPEMGREAATEMMRVAIATGEVEKIRKQLAEGSIEGSSATAVAMEKIASTIDRLRASSASTAPEITDFVKRVGAVGAQSGITIDQISALGSTISSLGMRVEMSATALSRMIPAIKNNAFDIARAIGVTPETIRNLFETGRGMEAILMIFQHMKDQQMDEDSIEKLLGMGGMQEVMKELNQQGARAGIVFAGLSQNVDELRRQLLVANNAYEENIAIQQEFDKMNETTAAKWERLKNQLEEAFVSDDMQRGLGWIINGLRSIIDLLTGQNSVSSFMRSFLVYLALVKIQLASIAAGALKSLAGGLKNIAVMLGFIKGEMKALQWSNIFTALGFAVLYAAYSFSKLQSALEKASEALGKTKEEIARAQERFEGYWQKLKDTSDALDQARASHDKLSVEIDKLRNSTDKGAESTENLKKKEDELKKSEDAVTKASNDHKAAITNMNSIYGKYLGFILTETNYANLAAVAHDKVAAAIEREMLAKQKQAAISDVDSNYSDQIASNYAKLSERLTSKGLDRSQSSQAMSDLQKFLRENTSYDAAKNQTVVSKAVTDKLKKTGLDLSKATANEIVALWYDEYLKNTYHLDEKTRRSITGVERRRDLPEGWGNAYSPFGTNVRGGYAETYVQRERERGAVSTVYDVDLNRVAGKEAESAGKLLAKLEKQAQDAKQTILDKKTSDEDRNKAYTELANALEGLDNRINELNPQKDAETINRLRDMAKSLSGEGINVKKLTAARREIHSTLFERATFDENSFNNIRDNNPWGSNQPADTTNYADMAADALVNRRKQMKEFVNSIQTDSDVLAVLKEDKALQKAIENGMSKDMRTVIEWYNTERLKIQDELHARHLTNTGDWMDPKKQKNRHKQFKAEMQAYLEELDAYYTERNQKIQEARNEEEITEGEAWRQTIENESEWHQRRAELQKLYADKSTEVTSQEQQAIFDIIAERTGDEADFIRKSIEKTKQFAEQVRKADTRGEAEYRKWMADLGLGWEKDFLKQAKAIGKQVKFMTDTLAKERPFNGISENLQENLTKMGIMVGNVPEKMHFLLGQIESAYTMDVKELVKRISDAGFKEWAKQIEGDTQVQQALLGQLRLAYEQVQDAIRKEASRIKKDADMMWKLTLMPDGTNLKQAADEALASMGLQQESIGRANSLIGAGVASENVASKLAIKQLQLQLSMQRAQYALMRKMGDEKARYLDQLAAQYRAQGKLAEAERASIDADNVRKSLKLAITEETKKEAELTAQVAKEQEEAQNRLYKELREWGDLLASSMQSIFEASNAGNAEYYNELAKLNLTGKGGPGAGTYIVIDNEGTEDARAHYEYLDERRALERQREIEQQNAQAEAWKKVMDDLNQKMADSITDWMNAMMQNRATEENTAELKSLQGKLGEQQATLNMSINAENQNTAALNTLTGKLSEGINVKLTPEGAGGSEFGADKANGYPTAPSTESKSGADFASDKAMNYPTGDTANTEATNQNTIAVNALTQAMGGQVPEGAGGSTDFASDKQANYPTGGEISPAAQQKIDDDNAVTENAIKNKQKVVTTSTQGDKKIAQSNQSTFAKMIQATNLYGVAYAAMSNDNMDMAQKFEMIALQAVGNAAIAGLQVALSQSTAQTAANMPAAASRASAEEGPIAGPILFAVLSALVGGLMGIAASKIAKSKSQIAQVTGASVGAGRLATGMLTYAEGNVNELTDPDTLTPGRHYNVDGADGKTYRAKYTGRNIRTHITSGPEFHLAGEKGKEAIIDAHTTRQIQMNEPEIWRTIQTLYNGGSLTRIRSRRGKGVRAFAEGNLDEFEEIGSEMGTGEGADTGMIMGQMAAFQQSLDRNSAIMERLADEGIEAFVSPYGKRGIVNGYDTYKKEAQRHGERY